MDLIGTTYVSGGNVTFAGSTFAWNPGTNTVTITLGATVSGPGVVGTDTTSTRKPKYTADGSINGSSGVAVSTAAFTAGTGAELF